MDRKIESRDFSWKSLNPRHLAVIEERATEPLAPNVEAILQAIPDGRTGNEDSQ